MIGLKSLTSKVILSRAVLGLAMGRHNKTASESLLDMPSGDRAGSLRKVALGGDWGSNPYPLANEIQAEPLNIADGSSDQFFTDFSDNGFRIRKELLDMHNYVRKLEAPAAKYMTKLIWDFHLEAYSREWARYLCDHSSPNFFDHSPDNQSGIPQWPYRMSTGENLYTSSAARPPTDDFSDVVKKWYDERADFNWSTGRSNDSSKPIGHWKQLVRPQATTVGCTVIGNCHNTGWKTYVVCHYDYGNIGTLPYEPGSGEQGLCQNCPSGFDGCCESGLCSGRSGLMSKSLAPYAQASQSTENWYGCATFKRDDCSDTGAMQYINSLPGSDLEFQQCSCGNDYRDFQDVVNNKYFYFRNRCYQGTSDLVAGDDNSDVNNIYAMISLKSIHERLFKDGKNHEEESAIPNPALEIEHHHHGGGGKKSGAAGKEKDHHHAEKVKSLGDIKDAIVDKFEGKRRRNRRFEALRDLSLSVDKDSEVNMDVKAAKGLMMKLSQEAGDSPDALKVSFHEGGEKEAVKDLEIPPSLKTRASELMTLRTATPPPASEVLPSDSETLSADSSTTEASSMSQVTTTKSNDSSSRRTAEAAPARRLQAISHTPPPTPSRSSLAKPPTVLNTTLIHEGAKLTMDSP